MQNIVILGSFLRLRRKKLETFFSWRCHVGGNPPSPISLQQLSSARRKKQRSIHLLQGPFPNYVRLPVAFPLYGEDAIDFGPCPKSRFWYDSQSFRPYGVSHGDDDYASRWSGPSSSALKGTYCFGVTG